MSENECNSYNDTIIVNRNEFCYYHLIIIYKSISISYKNGFSSFTYDIHKDKYRMLLSSEYSYRNSYDAPKIEDIRYDYLSKILKLNITPEVKLDYLSILDNITLHKSGVIPSDTIETLHVFVNKLINDSCDVANKAIDLCSRFIREYKELITSNSIDDELLDIRDDIEKIESEMINYLTMMNLIISSLILHDKEYPKRNTLQEFRNSFSILHHYIEEILTYPWITIDTLNEYKLYIHESLKDKINTLNVIDLFEVAIDNSREMHSITPLIISEIAFRKAIEEMNERIREDRYRYHPNDTEYDNLEEEEEEESPENLDNPTN